MDNDNGARNNSLFRDKVEEGRNSPMSKNVAVSTQGPLRSAGMPDPPSPYSISSTSSESSAPSTSVPGPSVGGPVKKGSVTDRRRAESLLVAENISKRFGGIAALSEMSLTVDRGEAVGVVGPNGAGKTTLFNCLLGIEIPDTGRIIFDGKRIDNLPVYKRARMGIARTFQRLELFSEMTVREHLLLAQRSARGRVSLLADLINHGSASKAEEELADHLLALLKLEDVADTAVDGLSLGHGRLVELGRALAMSPKLLMLDEPSSGLDYNETKALTKVLEQVREEQGVAVLLVEHDLEMVSEVVSRLYVLDFGRLIAEGMLDDVLSDTGVRQAYLGQVASGEGQR